jgi:hypothetical protein
MPFAHPVEFRCRTFELAQLKVKPIARVSKDFGTSESGLSRGLLSDS